MKSKRRHLVMLRDKDCSKRDIGKAANKRLDTDGLKTLPLVRRTVMRQARRILSERPRFQ